MQVWQRVFRGAAGPACYNIRGVISASQDGSGRENRGSRQRKWVTRPADAPPGLPARPGGHRGSGPRRRKSANAKPYIVKSACDQTIWDAHARLGPRTGDSRREGHMDPRTGDPGTAMPGRPGPGVKPPARRRGESRDSRMLDWDARDSIGAPARLDWDAPARLTLLPAWRHVSRAPAPSPPRSRHCAAAGSPSRRDAV